MRTEIITSKQNSTLVHVRKLLRSRSYREETGQYAAEGTKLLEEALHWSCDVQTVILTPEVVCPPIGSNVRVIQISKELMGQLSLQGQPQGAIFVCNFPKSTDTKIAPGTVILDGIQDPGNLGTILRTADALGIPVILSEGCADVYNPKTVRASMGAIFRSVPQWARRKDILESCIEANVPLWATAMGEGAVDIRAIPVCQYAVVIGNEGQGVSQEFLEAAAGTTIIPMNPRCESLNAAIAAAIVMWQMKR